MGQTRTPDVPHHNRSKSKHTHSHSHSHKYVLIDLSVVNLMGMRNLVAECVMAWCITRVAQDIIPMLVQEMTSKRRRKQLKALHGRLTAELKRRLAPAPAPAPTPVPAPTPAPTWCCEACTLENEWTLLEAEDGSGTREYRALSCRACFLAAPNLPPPPPPPPPPPAGRALQPGILITAAAGAQRALSRFVRHAEKGFGYGVGLTIGTGVAWAISNNGYSFIIGGAVACGLTSTILG